jgi:PAS domain S-box-containing protein
MAVGWRGLLDVPGRSHWIPDPVLIACAIAYHIAITLLDLAGFQYFSIEKLHIAVIFLAFFSASRGTVLVIALIGLVSLGLGYLINLEGLPLEPGPDPLLRFNAGLVIICGAWLAIVYQGTVEAIRKSEADLREAQRLARLGRFAIQLADFTPLTCSSTCLAILGRDGMEHLTLAELRRSVIHPQDLAKVEKRVQLAIRRSGRYEIEFRICRPGGEIRHVRSAGRVGHDRNGRAERLTGTLLDISEWRIAERERKEGEARLRSILAAVPDALVIVDGNGIIRSFSVSAQAAFGYRTDEVLGRSVAMLMGERYGRNPVRLITRYLRRARPERLGRKRKLSARRKDGSIMPAELSISAAALGKERLLIIFIRDLSDSQLLEEELRQAQKMDAIGQLTGGIAHDFNNLLTVIIGDLEMLEARLSNQRDLTLAREALQTAELGAELTSRLLAFARRQPLNPVRVDLARLMGEFEGFLRRSLSEEIEVQIKVEPGLPSVLVDPTQLQVALFNLAINARDAMPGGGKLSIRVGHSAGKGRSRPALVTISVTDNGMGMSEDVRKRAPEPFFTTKGPGSGTGLGLSMVYGFVKQSNGNIEIDSTQGNGTTVRLQLPAATGEAAKAMAPLHPLRGETALGGGEIILVVEDDARVRGVTLERLTALGYRTLEAASGAEALEKLAINGNVALVISDYVMPGGMNGGQLVQILRETHPCLPVILTTGHALPEEIQLGRVSGASWLAKPYGMDDLAGAVRDILRAHSSRATPPGEGRSEQELH